MANPISVLASRAARSSIVVATAVGTLCGCETAATEVLVRLDTNVPADRAMSVSATVAASTTPDGSDAAPTWWRSSDGGNLTLPGSFAVVPGAEAAHQGRATLAIVAEIASTVPGAAPIRFRRLARFEFESHIRQAVPIFLAIECGAPSFGCTSVAASSCTVSAYCEDRGLTCDRGRCVPIDLPSGDASADVGCAHNADCAPGLACRNGACVECSCPPPSGCQSPGVCADDGSARCLFTNLPDDTLCNDGDDCTHDDTCRAGVCGGTRIVCTSDACATRVCDGTAACAVVPHGTPVYETVDSYGYEYSEIGSGPPAFRLLDQSVSLYRLLSSAPDVMLSPDPSEANSCSWCRCYSQCQFGDTGRRFGVSATPLPGMVPLVRWTQASPIRHRSAIMSPGPGWVANTGAPGVPGYVCPP